MGMQLAPYCVWVMRAEHSVLTQIRGNPLMHAGTEGQGLWQAQDDVSERHGVRIVCQVCVSPCYTSAWVSGTTGARVGTAQQLRRARALLLSAQLAATAATDDSHTQQPSFCAHALTHMMYLSCRYPDFTMTPSGLQYKDLREGSGESPQPGDTLVVDWDGYTIGYYGRPFEARNKVRGGATGQPHPCLPVMSVNTRQKCGFSSTYRVWQLLNHRTNLTSQGVQRVGQSLCAHRHVLPAKCAANTHTCCLLLLLLSA